MDLFQNSWVVDFHTRDDSLLSLFNGWLRHVINLGMVTDETVSFKGAF